jgi:hypothetical protein
MTGRRGTAIASTAVAMAIVAAAVAASGWAATGDHTDQSATYLKRPRGQVQDCSMSPGWGRRDEFTSRQDLIVGPFALERARPTLAYVPQVRGNKIFVYVRGGHRVTLDLARDSRREVGLAFGPGAGFRNRRRVVSFIACRRGERTPGRFDGWPVTTWVGFLLATSPGCVALQIWIDDERFPRRAIIRFGVPSCD